MQHHIWLEPCKCDFQLRTLKGEDAALALDNPLGSCSGRYLGKHKPKLAVENLFCELVKRRFVRAAAGRSAMMGKMMLFYRAFTRDQSPGAAGADAAAGEPARDGIDMYDAAIGQLAEGKQEVVSTSFRTARTAHSNGAPD
jgi:hypothetical protein